MLIKYKEDFDNKINKAIDDLKKGHKYCPQCKEYYKNKAWETEYKVEKRNICTYRDARYGDDDIYEDVECSVSYDVCPVGHIFEKECTW